MNLAYNLKQSLIEKTEAALSEFSLINEVEVYSYTLDVQVFCYKFYNQIL